MDDRDALSGTGAVKGPEGVGRQHARCTWDLRLAPTGWGS